MEKEVDPDLSSTDWSQSQSTPKRVKTQRKKAKPASTTSSEIERSDPEGPPLKEPLRPINDTTGMI
jgi:hypothetical protein